MLSLSCSLLALSLPLSLPLVCMTYIIKSNSPVCPQVHCLRPPSCIPLQAGSSNRQNAAFLHQYSHTVEQTHRTAQLPVYTIKAGYNAQASAQSTHLDGTLMMCSCRDG
jgi:hypothetical protein